MILVKESKKLKMEELMAFCSFQRIILAILYKGNNIVCVCIVPPGLLWPLSSWPQGIQFISRIVPQGLPSEATRSVLIRGEMTITLWSLVFDYCKLIITFRL